MNILHATLTPTCSPAPRDAPQRRPRRHCGGLLLYERVRADGGRFRASAKDARACGASRPPHIRGGRRGDAPSRSALRSRIQSDDLVPRSQRDAAASDAAANISHGIAALDQTDASADAVERLRGWSRQADGDARLPARLMHAKAYLCWYDNHAEPGAAIVGSSNFTLAGFSGNTELNVRVTGDAEMAALKTGLRRCGKTRWTSANRSKTR